MSRKKLEEKQGKIIEWLLSHETDHPEYNKKLFEFRNAEIKISGIQSREKASRSGISSGIKEISIFHIN